MSSVENSQIGWQIMLWGLAMFTCLLYVTSNAIVLILRSAMLPFSFCCATRSCGLEIFGNPTKPLPSLLCQIPLSLFVYDRYFSSFWDFFFRNFINFWHKYFALNLKSYVLFPKSPYVNKNLNLLFEIFFYHCTFLNVGISIC